MSNSRIRPATTRRRLALAAGLSLLATVGLLLPLRSPALVVQAPSPGDVVGAEGIELMLRFSHEPEVAGETLRVLLNGADVTGEVTRGRNGAYGRLHGLLDGENLLRLEVFVRLWPGARFLVERGVELSVVQRRRIDLDRG